MKQNDYSNKEILGEMEKLPLSMQFVLFITFKDWNKQYNLQKNYENQFVFCVPYFRDEEIEMTALKSQLIYSLNLYNEDKCRV